MAKQPKTDAGIVIDHVELHDITNRIKEMAMELGSFQPVLDGIRTGYTESIPVAVHGQLEIIGSLSERINFELGQIAIDMRSRINEATQ